MIDCQQGTLPGNPRAPEGRVSALPHTPQAIRDGGPTPPPPAAERALSYTVAKSASQPASPGLRPIGPAAAYRKTAHRIRMAATSLIDCWGLDHVLFGTLTFRRPISTLKTAVARLQVMLDGLRKRHPELAYLWVVGRSRAGHLHLHVLFGVGDDVARDTDWDVVTRHDAEPADLRAAVNGAARDFWRLLARLGRSQSLGRMHLAPIHSSVGGVATYMAQNFLGFQRGRLWADRGRRAWALSRGIPRPPKTSDFTLLTEGNRRHRRRIAETAWTRHRIRDIDGARRVLGRRWHWRLFRETYQPDGHPGSAGSGQTGSPLPAIASPGPTRRGGPGRESRGGSPIWPRRDAGAEAPERSEGDERPRSRAPERAGRKPGPDCGAANGIRPPDDLTGRGRPGPVPIPTRGRYVPLPCRHETISARDGRERRWPGRRRRSKTARPEGTEDDANSY